MESVMKGVGFLNVLVLLLLREPDFCSGLTVTLSGVNPNGYIMNQAAAAPSAQLVCSYDLGSDTQPAEYVTFYKDGADPAHQIAVVKVADGASVKQNSYQGRSDVEVNANDPQYTLRIASLQYSDEGNYTCKVVLNFQVNTVTSSPQNLMVYAEPQPPQVSQSEVAPNRFQVECQSTGGRPAPTLTWYVRDAAGSEVEVNAANPQTNTESGDTFIASSTLERNATNEEPVTVICRATHPALSSPMSREQQLPPTIVSTSTTSTQAPTTTTGYISSCEIVRPSIIALAALALMKILL
ncbi:T-lymphocyte activation antigen CD80-like [Lingula anatina]|uniref:T-lymphocyte activation antigen CD80-like n=1 Tax=Lingula anatina TaxID=7574 RepID=A0A1S3HLF8_LINAN|nr:T-lymphocyte activation antigen CD80-like [Lingula anatina]|eukprot:XP_013386296.1 T-lymphocyte activation antigen CD80-like [Lingula anatina]